MPGIQLGRLRRWMQQNSNPATIAPSRFDTQNNSTGSRSRIARHRADTLLRIREGRENRFKIAVPAYESFTSDGTAGNTETFALSNDLVDCPYTQPVVVWLDGSYYGSPDATDFGADQIDVTDGGTGSTVHVYYTAGDSATLEVRKAAPSSSTSASQELYSENLALVQNTDAGEQPEFFKLSESALHPWVGKDMTVDVYVDASYTVQFSEDTDGTEATNALLNVPVAEANDEIGLKSTIKQDMGAR